MTTHPSAAGRLRPASAADFSRYAKNFAWLLRCPLQEAQKLLAQAYGFPDLHELQIELKRPGTPGPFDEPVRWPLFRRAFDPALVTHPVGVRARDLQWLEGSARENRLAQLMRDRVEEGWLDRRELGVFEAGFFCDPKTHRQLFANVKAGCLALESGSEEHQLDWLCNNWPVGFWPLLRELCGGLVEGDPDWRENPSSSQAFRLCQYRAPIVYDLMTSEFPLAPWVVSSERSGDGVSDSVKLCAGQAGLFEDDLGWSEEASMLFKARKLELSDEQWIQALEDMERFVHGQSAPLPDYLQRVESLELVLKCWRYASLRAWAQEFAERSPYDQLTVILDERDWPRQKPKPKALVKDFAGTLTMNLRLEISRSSVFESDGTPVTLWRYLAEFSRGQGKAESTPVGHVSGWLIVPWDNDLNFADDETLFEVMDAASAQLNDVWKVLKGQVVPAQGLHEVGELVEKDGFLHCLATAEVELMPAFRGQGLVPAMLEQISICLSDTPYNSVDAGWHIRSRIAAQQDVSVHDPYDEVVERSGLPLFGSPAIWVLPVEGEPQQDRVLRPHLRNSLQKLPARNATTVAERRKRKLMKHFLAMQSPEVGDIVCYDPHDYPGT